ncbi:MAG: WecB/TagA/CpsF family glycosyltransferase [Terracidiphilus sp.]
MTDSDFLHPRADVLGVRVSAVHMRSAVDLVTRWIETGKSGYVCLTGVHGVMEAQADPELRRILNGSFLNAPDGMPMTWVGRIQGHRAMDRVFGPDFMAALCPVAVEHGYRFFFYGGKPGVAPLLGDTLQQKFPGLLIAGTLTPPFGDLSREQEQDLLDQVRKAKPHILWVGLSTPKQERFMARHVRTLQVPLLVGVGAAFDFHTGAIRDCSPWIKRAGLQWVHRMWQDPARLAPRYLRHNPAFLWRIALQLCGLRRSSHDIEFDRTETPREKKAPA